MIRFSCPHCQREYLLHDAMFGLPLLCKGCGQRLTIPAPEPDPPKDIAPALVIEAPPPVPQQQPDAPRSLLPDGLEEVDIGFLSQETIAKLDLPLEVTPQVKAWEKPLPESHRAESTKPLEPPPRAASPRSNRKIIGVAADVAVVLVLLGVGVFLGEFAAGKSTREVMQSASGPKFPPLELLLWLAGPVLLLLVYALLGSRGKSVGAWLRRHHQRAGSVSDG